MQGVQVKLCYPLTMHALPERLRDASCIGDIPLHKWTLPLPYLTKYIELMAVLSDWKGVQS